MKKILLKQKDLDKFIAEAKIRWNKNKKYYPFIVIGNNVNISKKVIYKKYKGSKGISKVGEYLDLKIYSSCEENKSKKDILLGYAPIKKNKGKVVYGTLIPLIKEKHKPYRRIIKNLLKNENKKLS